MKNQVILSSWGLGALEFPDIRNDYADPKNIWRAWEKVLDMLKDNDLLSHVLYMDFDQEFPFFSPVKPKLDRLGRVKQGQSSQLSTAMEAAGKIHGGYDRLSWNPEQMKFVRNYFTSTFNHFQGKYPELRFTFSITSFWKEIRAMKIESFEVL